jgi:Asp-tRNA(Asn)/Glu-tRNA(Gln) amidotransferase C subunit
MTAAELRAVAALAGYAVSTAELEQVAALLAGMMDDIQRLRDLDIPDDVEPIITFRAEPWT